MPSRLLHCCLGSVPFVALAVALVCLLAPATALAQAEGEQPDTTQNKLLLPLIGGSGPDSAAVDEAVIDVAAAAKAKLNLIVDSDLCVDDATALLWLLGQSPKRVNLLGIVTVAGCTDLESATDNAFTVLDWMGKARSIPVIKGMPWVTTPNLTNWFLFGPDGLWGTGMHPNRPTKPSSDFEKFYCKTIKAYPDLTVLALGPDSNIARAYTSHARDCTGVNWSRVKIIALGGAKNGGNVSPVAEYNFWQDPNAANIVLTNGLSVTMVPLDAFTIPTVDSNDVIQLAAEGNAAAKKLAPSLQLFVNAQINNTGSANIPDAVAAVYALDQSVGTAQPALVKMELGVASLAYGQSIVALGIPQRVQLIADTTTLNQLALAFYGPLIDNDPTTVFDLNAATAQLNAAIGAILWSEPDNAQFVTTVQNDILTGIVLPDLSK